jgi:large subunit ribosomal protein L3
MKGILGRKVGMTQVFTKSGVLVPVTVIEIEPNVVTQIKTKDSDGYDAIQLGFSTKREILKNKPEIGHAKKANTTPKRFLREIRNVDVSNYQLGQVIKVDLFEEGEVIDVTGISKGKGFQGVIKRHNFSRGPMSHGSHFHRIPGSLGTRREKRVQLGHKLPGHMGDELVTIQNLEIVAVDLENNVILVKGNVPGPKKSLVIIRSAIKNMNVKRDREELINYNEVAVEEQNINEEVAEETNDNATDEVVDNEATAEETNEEQSSQDEVTE